MSSVCFFFKELLSISFLLCNVNGVIGVSVKNGGGGLDVKRPAIRYYYIQPSGGSFPSVASNAENAPDFITAILTSSRNDSLSMKEILIDMKEILIELYDARPVRELTESGSKSRKQVV